ncbi:hypothetical protein K2173_011130 [Erythroxylum novogranatense]|uniref:Sphingomyelin phosphodiesterase 4 n=1 Tax=Erythroxylum novogranatense TaxID=1862640 RepID=A0AAV8SRQ6_9ROSI|nr:hypothetical protein K2173_011130 [Erythroxylum novogranatense]
MRPHSYTIDSVSKSQDLATAILASSTPAHVSSVCASIDTFLHSLTPDQSRHFFSLTFPILICKLYGFDDAIATPNATHHHSPSPSGGGWIDVVLQSNDPNLASRIFNLLSPNGTLFQSISAVDRLSLVKYVFPVERLPEWARLLLSSGKDCNVLSELCIIFKGKIKEDSMKGSSHYQVQLNVFQYFIFWFAYYPICKGNSENFNTLSIKRPKRFNLENWASSVTGFSGLKRGNEQKLECNVYLRLLYAYLRAFVPIFDLGSHQPYRSSLLNYGRGSDGSTLLRAEFFVDTLVHYWLAENDFSPLPVSFCKSFGLWLPLRSVLGESPPSSNLGEVVKLLVRYLNLSAIEVKEGFDYNVSPGSIDSKSRELVPSLNNSMRVVESWNSWIQRPVYRFILRTFLFCPVGTSIKNASHVFSIWVTYMEPWNSGLDDFMELDAIVDGPLKNVKEAESTEECGYKTMWRGYVLSNYLYYSSLVMHFIGFAHKFLHTDPEAVIQMVSKVMKVLTASKEVIHLMKSVDILFHSKQAGLSKSMFNSLYGYIPLIREQLQDWEDGLCETDADGSFLHENWNRDLKLFSNGEDGGQHLLQLFILRAEAELQANSGHNLADNLSHLSHIVSLKEQVSCLFGGYTVKNICKTSEAIQCEHSRDEIFRPRRTGNKSSADIKYKGDWMKRPISHDEVAWLAKLLVWLSNWLNENLGLNHSESSCMGPKWSYVEVAGDSEKVCGSMETMKMVLCAIGSWLLMLIASLLGLMRKHGVRVNLRILASKKIVLFFCIYALFSTVKKTVGMFYPL